ncbi:MAG: trypsin-like peptidase domain-containing protein [Bradymonadaceae bacterium]
MKIKAALLALMLMCTTAISAEAQTTADVESTTETASVPTLNQLRVTEEGVLLPDVRTLFEEQRESVVSVQTELSPAMGGPAILEPFFGPPSPAPRRGQGSAFFVNSDGTLITNWHVVAGAQSIMISLAGGERFEAELIGADATTDIALLRVNTGRLMPAVSLGSSDLLRPGEWVVAIGSPFGLEHSVTVGVLSATERRIGVGPYDNFLQTDASINPGNSGGPLFNMAGEVVGVNTAVIRNGQGIGFAVPIDLVRRVLPELLERGHVVRGYIGAGIQDLVDELARSFGVPDEHGILISNVEEGGPAARAGIEPGDIILTFAGTRVRTTPEFLSVVADTTPGVTVTAEYLRDGEQARTQITPGERPDPARAELEEHREAPQPRGRLGVIVRPVSPSLAQQMGIPAGEGVIVESVEIGAPAARVLRRGDIILDFNGQELSQPDDLRAAIEDHPPGEAARMRIRRDDVTIFVGVELP